MTHFSNYKIGTTEFELCEAENKTWCVRVCEYFYRGIYEHTIREDHYYDNLQDAYGFILSFAEIEEV